MLTGELPGALYLRAANALERSALLAEDHAERLRADGRGYLAGPELESAKRARAAAERGRAPHPDFAERSPQAGRQTGRCLTPEADGSEEHAQPCGPAR